MNFGSHVDGVVALSAALVNVATPGAARGRPYALPSAPALTRGIGDALRVGSRSAADPSARATGAFVELAGSVRPVYESVEAADVDTAADTTNALLDRYAPNPRLAHHDGEPWHLHYHGSVRDDPSGWGGSVATALATVLGGEYADRLGVCAAPVCDRVFVDVSRNGTRRFCSEVCQNRVKAAAHRARHRS
ncbi:CGNR zinc finger domain-containing protein [uncultured Jatrophihabitans sp.]|uniref:CGNR zinc finger domain-containing protein n=1 Tax=uncultured Jatrophihabitans sp. TaxID=1610747 RepID=UPI0035CA8E2F